jgi:hypothetical protein
MKHRGKNIEVTLLIFWILPGQRYCSLHSIVCLLPSKLYHLRITFFYRVQWTTLWGNKSKKKMLSNGYLLVLLLLLDCGTLKKMFVYVYFDIWILLHQSSFTQR